MPLSALHRHLVRRIFSRLAANPDNSTTLFYQRLFELNPHLRTVKDLENFEQQHHLMEILALAVKFMDQPVELAGWVEDMRRYNLGNLGEPHQVEAALLWLVEKQFDGVLTREMLQGWVQFCQWFVLLLLVNAGLDES